MEIMYWIYWMLLLPTVRECDGPGHDWKTDDDTDDRRGKKFGVYITRILLLILITIYLLHTTNRFPYIQCYTKEESRTNGISLMERNTVSVSKSPIKYTPNTKMTSLHKHSHFGHIHSTGMNFFLLISILIYIICLSIYLSIHINYLSFDFTF